MQNLSEIEVIEYLIKNKDELLDIFLLPQHSYPNIYFNNYLDYIESQKEDILKGVIYHLVMNLNVDYNDINGYLDWNLLSKLWELK